MHTQSAHTRHPRRFGPALLAVAAFGALVAAWLVLAPAHVPAPLMHPNQSDGRLVWAAPGVGPFHALGDVEHADLLFVGDSRVHDDLVLEVFAGEALGAPATLWGPGAYVPHLLPLAAQQPARRIVVGLSFLSLAEHANPLVAEALREQPPAPSRLAAPADAARWRERQFAHLVATGADRAAAAAFTGDLAEALMLHYTHVGWFTGRFDAALAARANYARVAALPTITTRPWRSAWFEAPEPERLARWAGGLARLSKPAARAAAAEAIAAALRALVADGRQVVCVRLPMSPALLNGVRPFVPDAELRAVAEAAGVPLLEHQAAAFETRDGSHLTWREAERYSRFLAEELRRLGW
ncbi:MAG: hypothetical protein R3F49_23335 [Planctomycetota bacterium]